jgi:hypothetical protein
MLAIVADLLCEMTTIDGQIERVREVLAARRRAAGRQAVELRGS